MSTTGFGRAIGAVALLLTPLNGCDEAPPPPRAAPAAPAPAAAAAPVEAASSPAALEPPAAPEAAAAPEPRAEALPEADEATRSKRLISHYRALHCLREGGAGPEQIAQAYTASGLSASAWDQALGELLAAMGDAPKGEIAQAIRAARSKPCAGGAAASAP